MIEEFYKNNYKRLVHTVAKKLNGDRTTAEDVVQEAFLKAVYFFPAYDPERGKLSSWFNTIMYNVLSDVHNNRKEHTVDSDAVTAQDVVGDSIKTSDFSAFLVKKISEVKNEKHRDILTLFYIYGFSSKDIPYLVEDVSQTLVTTTATRFKERLK